MHKWPKRKREVCRVFFVLQAEYIFLGGNGVFCFTWLPAGVLKYTTQCTTVVGTTAQHYMKPKWTRADCNY